MTGLALDLTYPQIKDHWKRTLLPHIGLESITCEVNTASVSQKHFRVHPTCLIGSLHSLMVVI
uniref:Uncharacterized protein n=1 Tax=Arion vulgaris TaxID=1028688 RepID=A0A0B6XY69_9EUPU